MIPETNTNAESVLEDNSADVGSLNWGQDAPRGGKTVMNRVLKDNANVPLFFAQTLIQSLRDVGYNHTTSALCEHVDNAIQAGARQVRIFFRQIGKKADTRIDAAVYDDGRGMPASVLKAATAFGGSMNFGKRDGIGRFGMGMKTAALSMSPLMELYSWQERDAYYNMTLDVDAIGKERANLVLLSDPRLLTELPDEVAEFFKKPLSFPSDRHEQVLLANEGEDLSERLGASGTIVYMPECDRLTYAKVSTLVDHAVKEMARVYRRAIASGLKLYVNNRIVEALDPTYSMVNARHVRMLEGVSVKNSRLIVSKSVPIKLTENGTEAAPIIIKLFRLPIEEWSSLPKKVLRNDLRMFDGMIVSILRNDRELFAGALPRIISRHSVTNWYRLQIDFPGTLDEAFGVAANKQGVRMKGYVELAIKDAIGEEVSHITEEIKRFQSEQSQAATPAKPSASEAKASEADPFQPKELPTSPEEEAQLDANLRGLALTVKRGDETDDQAFERVKSSKYILVFQHDEYWPFYDVKHRFGRVILTINTAHPFFTQLYEPIKKAALAQQAVSDEDGVVPTTESLHVPDVHQQGPIVALELLLLSLARTQGRLANASDEARKVLDDMRREWSEAYRIQLST